MSRLKVCACVVELAPGSCAPRVLVVCARLRFLARPCYSVLCPVLDIATLLSPASLLAALCASALFAEWSVLNPRCCVRCSLNAFSAQCSLLSTCGCVLRCAHPGVSFFPDFLPVRLV
eukprot:6179526-Pleurochrysis_carterae.AAC.3